MVSAVPDILARITARKREELPAVQSRLDALAQQAEKQRANRRDFRRALTARPPAIIAEIKKASPSKGVLAADFQPVQLAREYSTGGAAALSVLTDEPFFQGRLSDLEVARAAVDVPVLRKDFTLDEAHVIEAAAHGADAILLIAAILSTAELRRLREEAARWGLAALVEVHDGEELESAADSGAEILGVNNRNLHTFHVDLETSLRLAERMPPNTVRVSESGIESPAQVRRLQAAGYHAFLVGEHLMRAGAPALALQALRA